MNYLAEKRSGGKTPHSLQLTLFYGQRTTKKMNHNLLNVLCVRVLKCVLVSGGVNQPIGGGAPQGGLLFQAK